MLRLNQGSYLSCTVAEAPSEERAAAVMMIRRSTNFCAIILCVLLNGSGWSAEPGNGLVWLLTLRLMGVSCSMPAESGC